MTPGKLVLGTASTEARDDPSADGFAGAAERRDARKLLWVQRDHALRLQDRLVAQLASVEAWRIEIDAALERLAAGTYGRCQRCGGQIPEKRLACLPATRYCAADDEIVALLPRAK